MSVEDTRSIEELRTAVAVLRETLSLSERRTARLERTLRWGALAIAVTTGLALTVALQPLGHAVGEAGTTPSRSAEEAIDRLTQSLTGPQSTLGQMGMLMQNLLGLVTQRAMSEGANLAKALADLSPPLQESDCRGGSAGSGAAVRSEEQSRAIEAARTASPLGYYATCFFLQNHFAKVNGGYRPEDYQAAVVAAMGGTAVELGVLVHRLRYDSDYLQQLQTLLKQLTPAAALEGIAQQLETLNYALASVPQMTVDMNVMTQQMGVMSADMTAMTHHMGAMNYSMGSTMGRMGSWVPW